MPRVIYVPNGGVFRGKTDPTTIRYDYDEVITIAEAPTREGYTFLYWKGSEYSPGDSYKVVDPVHLFVAQWKKNEEPVDPDEPDKPDKAKKKVKEEKDEEPETGDVLQLGYLLVMLLSILTMVGVVWRRRREE